MRKKCRYAINRCTRIISYLCHLRSRYELLDDEEEGESNEEAESLSYTVKRTAGPEDVSAFWKRATVPRFRHRRSGKCERDLRLEFVELKQMLRLTMLREYNLI